jgi:transmembrane sensor
MKTDIVIRYITGKVNETEKLEFEKWLNASEENTIQFQEFKIYWNRAGNSYQNYSPDTTKAWELVSKNTIQKQIEMRSRRNNYATVFKIAASILILVSLAVVGSIIYSWSQKEVMICYTSDKNIITIQLPDKSTVWLNAHSELQAPKEFKGSKRNVYLKGEAFFEVTKNPKRPFRIYAKSTITEVVGTSFNLQSLKSDSNVCLTVVTGKVAFYTSDLKGKKALVLPGQQGLYDASKQLVVLNPNSNANFLAWKTRKLQFKNTSLPEVCKSLESFYHITIVHDPLSNSKNYSFTGQFANSPLNETLNVIELSLGVKFIYEGNAYKIQFAETL